MVQPVAVAVAVVVDKMAEIKIARVAITEEVAVWNNILVDIIQEVEVKEQYALSGLVMFVIFRQHVQGMNKGILKKKSYSLIEIINFKTL